jgi:hypothetical protein
MKPHMHMGHVLRFSTATIIGFVIMGAIILCGFQRYRSKMPFGATCSAVLSAACHQPRPDDAEAYRFPIQ